MNDAIPPARFPLRARAPGKAILFGEHAVVFGKTAVVLALGIGTEVELREAGAGKPTTYNGSEELAQKNPYLQTILRSAPAVGPLEVHVRSEIPRASGLGSSAALTAALTAGILGAQGGAERSRLALESFRSERGAQGVGSPVDTSAAVAGGILTVGREPSGTSLWGLPPENGNPGWQVGRIPDPGWTWVVGYTGIPKDTATVVRRVGERVKAPDGPSLLDRISQVSKEGAEALRNADRERVGRLMQENQRLLVELGISHPRLEELLRSVGPHVLGAKITGAGGGGSILALAPKGGELLAGRAISHAGGVPFLVKVDPRGAAILP